MRERWGDAYDSTYNADADDLWASYVLERDAEVRVVELDGAVVAVGALVPDGPGTGRLVRVAVDGRHRRQGLASMIVRGLLEAARTRGMAAVRVSTDRPWTDAVALYRSCGFEQSGEDDIDIHLVRAP